MTEKQQMTWKWAARAIGVIMGITGVLAAAKSLPVEVQHYAALATAILGVIYGKVHSWLPSSKPAVPPVAVLLLAAGLMVSAGCPGAGWRTLDSVQKAKALTAQQVAEHASKEHSRCLKKHGKKTPEYATCIKPTREMLTQWRKHIRPAINSSVQITASALVIAEKAKSKVDWMALLKPAACGLMRVAKSWGHFFADKGATIMSVLNSFEGLVCHE